MNRTLLLSALFVVACKGAEPPAPVTASAEPGADPAPAPVPHPKGVPADHPGPGEAPPPAATRANPAEELDQSEAVILISDIDVAPGQTETASIEVRPKGKWKINKDFPVRVTLSGVASASPPALELEDGFQITAGGLRVDIPFIGDAPGEDRVTAKVRYGVCSESTCLIHKADVEWRVIVAP